MDKADVLRDTLATNKAIERAYVTISHDTQHDGMYALVIESSGNDFDARPMAVFKIKNFGRTPAMVERISLAFIKIHEPLPDEPPYIDAMQAGHFLVSGDHVIVQHPLPALLLTRAQRQEIEAGTLRAMVLGYVDYVDKFGGIHRGGYARMYRDVGRNNLVVVPNPSYNYDRER